MIYQPRNVQPSSSAIDVTKENMFSMEVQTSFCISGYQLSILDFDNNVVYSGEKETVSPAAYNGEKLYMPLPANSGTLQNGMNYKWRTKLYQTTADIIITYGNVQGASSTTEISIQSNINIHEEMMLKIGSQTKKINSYDIETGIATVDEPFLDAPEIGTQYYVLSDFIETTPDYIIYARSTPEVSISDVEETLTLKYHTFNGVYNQSDNVPITYHQFDLYIVDENGNLVELDTSGKVYSAKLVYTYDGFRTGNDYYIKLTVENDLGIIVSTELYPFSVQYEIIEYIQQPTAKFNSNNNAIDISWVTPVENVAKTMNLAGEEAGAKYLYNTPYSPVNSLYTDGYIAEWENENGLYSIPDDFNITTQFSPDGNFYIDEYNRYSPIRTIIDAESESVEKENCFRICLDIYNILYLTPLVVDEELVTINVTSYPSSEDNKFIHIYIDQDFNFEEHPYIVLRDRNYMAKVAQYDRQSKKITLQWELPFEPSVGETIILTQSMSKPLYEGTNEIFVLTSNGVPQINSDYVWNDNSIWNDNFIWTEGGTSIERVCNHWWKVQITNNNIRTEEIYPSAS